MSTDSTKLLLYDFETRKWRQLAQGSFGNPEWSRDDACVYAVDIPTMTIICIPINDGKIMPVVNLDAERLAFTGLGI